MHLIFRVRSHPRSVLLVRVPPCDGEDNDFCYQSARTRGYTDLPYTVSILEAHVEAFSLTSELFVSAILRSAVSAGPGRRATHILSISRERIPVDEQLKGEGSMWTVEVTLAY